MRRGRVLLILGVVLIVGGLFALFYAAGSSGAQDVAPIAPNNATAEYFTEYEFSVLAGGTVQGSFSVVNNTPVTVFVFNDADYNAYVNGQNLTGLYTVTAASGSINLQVSGWNTYHIVFAHGPGYTFQEQDVAVNLTSTGIDPTYFLGGLVAAIVGVLLAALGVRSLRRTAAQHPSGVLDSRATYLPPPSPAPSPSSGPGGEDAFRVPPPLPGTPEADAVAVAAPPVSSAPASLPTGNVVVTLENRGEGAETVQLVVNGAPVTTFTVAPNTSQVTTVTAQLASPFGSMVRVQAVTSSGRRVEQSVFVGARGNAQIALRVA